MRLVRVLGLGATVFKVLKRSYSFETFESAASHMLARHVQTARRTPRFYERATDTFSLTVKALELARPTVPRSEYERLAKYSRQAHAKVDQARNELDRHIAEHDCSSAISAQA